MIHRLQTMPPERGLPPEYALRLARPEDGPALASLLNAAYQDHWDAARVNEVLLENDDVPLTWVVDRDGSVVAVASYQRMPAKFPESGFIHYVAADADHSGKGLGYAVTRAVLAHVASQSHDNVRLTTDDWRLPAIATYLKLGFEPESWHESHPERWNVVLAKLGERP
jgi:mycothiol synthase